MSRTRRSRRENQDLNNIDDSSHSEDIDQRSRVTIPLQRFIEAAEVNSEDDSNYAQSEHSEITDARSTSSEYDSGDQEIAQQVLVPRRRQRDDLYEFSESDQIESDDSLSVPGRQRRRLNSDVEDEQSEEKDEKSDERAPSPQDQTMKDVLKKLAPTPKRKQRDNQRAAIQLIEARMHQKAKHYDALNPDIDEDRIKALHEKSKIDLTPLIIRDQPVLVESENNELHGAMLKNLTSAQRTLASALIAICEEGKEAATEKILDALELVAKATSEGQQLRKQALYYGNPRLSSTRPPASAALSHQELKQFREDRSVSGSQTRRGRRFGSFGRGRGNLRSRRGRRSYPPRK